MAADYKQPKTVEKRVRFFDGQFLQDQDFIDEQKYHLDRERRHNRLLHVAGIAEGLTVTSPEANKVIVTAGTAIDSDGRQIVLAQPQTAELPAAAFNDQQGIKLSIAFREMAVELQQSETGSDDYTRWHELPEITIVRQGEDSVSETPRVLLAELALDNQGAVTINNDVRQYSGLRLPGPAADAAVLRTSVNSVVGLTGSLSIQGKLTVNDVIEINNALIPNIPWPGTIPMTVAAFSHKDFGNFNKVALQQMSHGTTILNAPLNSQIHFSINGETKMSLYASGEDENLHRFQVGLRMTVKKSLQVDDALIRTIDNRNYAAFSHRRRDAEKDYALAQDSSGQTNINAASRQIISFRINDEHIMGIDKDGWVAPSDARLKQGIEPLCNTLDRVMQLHPRSYCWANSKDKSKKIFGFIAQEVQKIYPDFVREMSGFKGLCYDNFSVLAIAAIQEQQQSIEKLQKEVSSLKEKITSLTKQPQ